MSSVVMRQSTCVMDSTTVRRALWGLRMKTEATNFTRNTHSKLMGGRGCATAGFSIIV